MNSPSVPPNEAIFPASVILTVLFDLAYTAEDILTETTATSEDIMRSQSDWRSRAVWNEV